MEQELEMMDLESLELEPLQPAEDPILAFLKGMRFKRGLMGVPKEDALDKLRTLHRMHSEKLEAVQAELDALKCKAQELEDARQTVDTLQQRVAELEQQLAEQAQAAPSQPQPEAPSYDEQVQAMAQEIVGAHYQAAGVLEDAQRKADEILIEANAQADQRLEESRRQAYELDVQHQSDLQKLLREKDDALEYLRRLKVKLDAILADAKPVIEHPFGKKHDADEYRIG